MADPYDRVERDSEEWDRMWQALIDLLKRRYGSELWEHVFVQCGYMGESVAGGHCFRAKEIVFPDGTYLGRIYFEIPDGRTQAVV